MEGGWEDWEVVEGARIGRLGREGLRGFGGIRVRRDVVQGFGGWSMQIEMEEEAPPTPVVLEGALSSTILDLDQSEHQQHFGANHGYGRENHQREGVMDEGDVGGSSGGGVGGGEDEDGMEGEGKERGDKEGEGMGRKRRAEIWQDAEMDALVRAFREVHMKLTSAAGTGKKVKQVFKSANDKWQEVRTLLLASGVDRQPKEIERKWSNLSTAFKQIADWNKKQGRPSYWDLDETLKKEKTKAKELPATFRVQLFDSMAEFMGDRQATPRRLSAQPQPQAQAQAQAQAGALVALPGPLPGLPRPPPPPGAYQSQCSVLVFFSEGRDPRGLRSRQCFRFWSFFIIEVALEQNVTWLCDHGDVCRGGRCSVACGEALNACQPFRCCRPVCSVVDGKCLLYRWSL